MKSDFDSIRKRLQHSKEDHRIIADAIMQRLRMSRDKMSERYEELADNERQFNAYVPTREVDELRKRKKKVDGTHDYVTIEVPYSYAVVMTIHTYLTSVFLARSPVYQIQARHGEPEMQVQQMEALLDYQRLVGKHSVPLFAWLFDPLRYGFGVLGQYWDEEEIQVRKFVDVPETFLGVRVPGGKVRRESQVERVPGYRGTKLFNVRPQDFFPDTRLPLSRFQEGEFCGRYVEIPWLQLEEGAASGRYFNLDKARRARSEGGMLTRETGADEVMSLPGETIDEYQDSFPAATRHKPDSIFRGFEIQWRLRPNMWKLGDEGRHEVWIFTVSKEGTIIEARPQGMYYNGFSYDVILFEPDGYNLFPYSALERIKPLNDVLSWLVNTHFYNIRAALNNQFIVDPTAVVMKDVTSRTPGQVIRLKPEAFGRDVRTAITQLPVGDVTGRHLQDAQIVEMMIQRALGATDQVMGMQSGSGRKTATEIRTATSFGANRLKTMCELASAYGFEPMVQRLIQTTQQMYEDDGRKFRLVGDLASFSPTATAVDPEAIMGFYDFVPVDGTLPIDRYAQVQLWNQLMQQGFQIPQVAQSYDFGRIFAWVAALAGLKNVNQFRIQPTSGESLQQQVQAGNAVPVEEAMRDLNAVPDEGRPEGMGQTG